MLSCRIKVGVEGWHPLLHEGPPPPLTGPRSQQCSPGSSPKPGPSSMVASQRTPLAVLARVAVRAGAAVLVGLGVDAGAPIDTGVVVATVVQVWGQGQSSGTEPAVPTSKLGPGLHPCPFPTPSYLCHRAGHPSWSHSHSARAPHSCRAHSQGRGHTRHRTSPASRSCTWGGQGVRPMSGGRVWLGSRRSCRPPQGQRPGF